MFIDQIGKYYTNCDKKKKITKPKKQLFTLYNK